MELFQTNQALGLDVGQSTVKAVRVRRRGRSVELVSQHLLDCHAEGIVDESELREHLPAWLRQVGCTGYETVLGLPQYMATTQLTDFPPGKHTNFDRMVAYETQHLAGLSDDQFLHDFALMPAQFGYRNPVLIGICREEVAARRGETFGKVGVALAGLAMNGIALANAYHSFYPDAARLAAPQLLIDIGTESSTIVIVAGGLILYAGSLMFGSDRFTQALAKAKGLGEEAAETAKRSARLDPLQLDSPLVQMTGMFQSELDTAIEHWRSQERPEIGGIGFARVGLCGGGARLSGLTDYFTRSFGCEVELLGVPRPDTGVRNPDFLIAYGLACQGLQLAPYNISLLPPALAWTARRRQRFAYLASATAVAALLSIGFFTHAYRGLKQERAQLRQELVKLQECGQLVPQLQQVTATIDLRQRMLIPFVAKGNRAEISLRAVQLLSQCRGDDDWFVYLADAEYFQRRDGAEPGAAARPTPGKPVLRSMASLLSLGISSGSDAPDSGTGSSEFGRVASVDDLRPWRRLVVAGCTPLQRQKTYHGVRLIVDKLNATSLCSGVDILPESQCVGREDIFEPWLEVFADNRLEAIRYKAFFLELPLSTLDITSGGR